MGEGRGDADGCIGEVAAEQYAAVPGERFFVVTHVAHGYELIVREEE